MSSLDEQETVTTAATEAEQGASLLSRFNAFVDACIPDSLVADHSQVFQARTLVTFVMILSLFGAIGMGFTIFVEQSLPLRRFITICMLVCMSLSIVIMRKTNRLREAGLYFVSLCLVIVAYVDFMNRSLDGPATVLWVLPYAITAMLLGSKTAAYIGVCSIFLMLTNAMLLTFGMLPTSLSDPNNWSWLRLILVMIVLCIVAVSVYGLTSLEKRRQWELSQEIEFNKEIMTELGQATIEAQAAARSKELFLATMSHELRTPLNGVLGNAELLAKEVNNVSARSRVDSISASGKLLLSIINDVLDFSKFESQGVTLNPEPFDLAQCLRELCQLIRPRVNEGVQLSSNGLDDPLYINADANRLSQVVLNLLSNAAKFTEKGLVSLSLSKPQEGLIRIQVSDTGNGISEENQKRLFQDFVQVGDDTRKHNEGTGLGLAITRRIVDRMDGDIQVVSSPGKGTTMSVILPVELVDKAKVQAKNEYVDQEEELDLTDLKVLIVDDVELNCLMLEGMLEALDVKACCIERDGHLAVSRIKEDDQFDLVMMDVRMPTMDGLEATRQIRALGYTGPVIAVTANAFEEDREECLYAGMTGFLAKPINMEALQAVLSEVIA